MSSLPLGTQMNLGSSLLLDVNDNPGRARAEPREFSQGAPAPQRTGRHLPHCESGVPAEYLFKVSVLRSEASPGSTWAWARARS